MKPNLIECWRQNHQWRQERRAELQEEHPDCLVLVTGGPHAHKTIERVLNKKGRCFHYGIRVNPLHS